MLDLVYENQEISLLIGLFIIEWLYALFVKNDYRKQKAIGWMMITFLWILFFVHEITRAIAIGIISILAIYEFAKIVRGNFVIQWLLWIVFLVLIAGRWYFVFTSPSAFIYLFIAISASDVAAYTIGTLLPWRKWFTQISPNKTFSGFVGQIVFLALVSIWPLGYAWWIVPFIGVLAPLWDLAESWMKRKAWVKDTANYIPGHGGILDRIDSSVFIVNLILLAQLLHIL